MFLGWLRYVTLCLFHNINVLLDNITVFSNICLNSDIMEICFAHVSMLF